jgi:hypothetical protein
MSDTCINCKQGLSCLYEPPCLEIKATEETPPVVVEQPQPRQTSQQRANKRDAVLRDPQSTGRKRAARLYPLDENAACEWQGKANCGGAKGVVGCISGTQQARHHGPDKSVVNNEGGNVHRICHACHNRWHRTNNEDYNWNVTTVKPHAPRKMTAEERAEAESRKSEIAKKIVD